MEPIPSSVGIGRSGLVVALYGRGVLFGMLCAIFAAICYGVASTMQAVVARGTRDDRQGVDPRLLFRLLGQWRYVASLGLDVVGLVAQITALRMLPLFLVQAAMAASIAVTALLATRWFGMRLSRVEWASVAVVCAGLAVLGAAAQSEGAGHGGHAFHYILLIAALALALLGVAAGRLPDPTRTAALGLVSGLCFGAMGTAIRVLPSLSPGTLVTDPATYAAAAAGVLAGWFYASALQRGGVVAATAMMLIGETVPPSVIGVLLLGDHTRPGWVPVAVAGFAVALAGALVLARFGEIPSASPASSPGPDEPAVAGVAGG
jgi:drug/metabolite transporter (DMT)-like permease